MQPPVELKTKSELEKDKESYNWDAMVSESMYTSRISQMTKFNKNIISKNNLIKDKSMDRFTNRNLGQNVNLQKQKTLRHEEEFQR